MSVVAKWLDGSRCSLVRTTEVGLGPGNTVLATPPKGHSPQLSVDTCYGRTAGWIKMPLGREVGLSPGHIVLDGDPAPPQKGTAPNFRFMPAVAKQLDGSRCHLAGR